MVACGFGHPSFTCCTVTLSCLTGALQTPLYMPGGAASVQGQSGENRKTNTPGAGSQLSVSVAQRQKTAAGSHQCWIRGCGFESCQEPFAFTQMLRPKLFPQWSARTGDRTLVSRPRAGALNHRAIRLDRWRRSDVYIVDSRQTRRSRPKIYGQI